MSANEDRNNPQGTPQDGVHFDLSNIRKKDLTASELSAVTKLQDEMEKRDGKKATFEEAMAEWMQNVRQAWLHKKVKEDNEAQKREIERHKWIESQKAGHDIGEREAIQDWVNKYAPVWRKERESLQKNGWEVVHVVVGIEQGLHMRPSSTLASIAGSFKCQVYVHRDGMEVSNFSLEGKGYLNVKSLMGLLTLGAIKNDKLEFIASGAQARQCLESMAEFVSGGNKDYIIRNW